ncbi:helix-turn-helix domain-containing protein [Enterococcus massiliensis]|uniref:helix-turn-helix domain-containing protein n=1 Tax=Enterococcus massiliensis TaxID=1640685 RepID=UPI00065DC7B4|nr:helix-turn-helix transcriptional regulator [Enterococcus massiliensis]
MDNLGSFFGELRKSKGITQSKICKNIISRTTLSKFENGKLIPSAETFILLLDRLDISFDEFMYICRGYELSNKNKIIKDFFSLFSNQNIDTLYSIRNHCILIQKESYSRIIDLVIPVLDSQIELYNNSKKEIPYLPKIQISKIWQEIQLYSFWSLDDIKILNCCLYLFPLETATHIANQLLVQLNKYDNFTETRTLKCAIYLNLSLLLLQNGQYHYAEKPITQALILSKNTKRYDYYALSISRQGLIKHSEELIQRGLQISKLFSDTELENLIQEEKNLFY